MRAAPSAATGFAGQSTVKAQFERLGWAAVPNPEHDLGTDLWVTPRDDRGFEPGLMIGVQVKAGASFFRRATVLDGSAGWWFNDRDQRHLRHWLAHVVPHLLVLHDPVTECSYWVPISKAGVRWMRKGGKLFVPERNSLDRTALPELMRAAASSRQRPRWDGSAWSGAPELAPTDLLRHALIAPRLIAPHPNASSRALDAHHKIALIAAGRGIETRDLDSERPRSEVEKDEWAEALHTALRAYLRTGSLDLLRDSVRMATRPHELAAAGATLCAALVEFGMVDEALAHAEAALNTDTLEPVDHAWLSMHRARCLLEIGRTREAIALGVQAQAIVVTHPHDVTAAAIAASGASLVFRGSDIGSEDIAATVSTTDTEVTWWRTQSTAWGLGSAFETVYRDWAASTRQMRFGADGGGRRLRAVALTAGLVASHDAWSHASSTWIRWALLSGASDTVEVADLLVQLCRTGDTKTVAMTVEKLLRDGPAAAVRSAADTIDPTVLTHTEARATLELLRVGADVVGPIKADQIIVWILDALSAPDPWVARVRPNFLLVHHLVEVATALLPAASHRANLAVRRRLLALGPVDDDGDATQWARLLLRVPASAWTPPQIAGLAARDGDASPFADAILKVVARHDRQLRTQLIGRLRRGDLTALGQLGDLSRVPSDAVDAVMSACAAQLRQRLVHSGITYTRYVGADPGSVLVNLNVTHPDRADWEPIREMLESPGVQADVCAGALRSIAANADRISPSVVETLTSRLEVLRKRPDTKLFESVSALPNEALTALRPADLDLVGVLSTVERNAALRAVARTRDLNYLPALIALATDDDGRVRGTAASVISWWATTHARAVPLLHALEVLLIADAGTLVARNVVEQWHQGDSENVREIASTLREHLSAEVRNRVAEILEP